MAVEKPAGSPGEQKWRPGVDDTPLGGETVYHETDQSGKVSKALFHFVSGGKHLGFSYEGGRARFYRRTPGEGDNPATNEEQDRILDRMKQRQKAKPEKILPVMINTAQKIISGRQLPPHKP